MKKPILIGIAGASGSGKTLVANSIVESIGLDKAMIIQEDSYYTDCPDTSYDERVRMNYDHPDAFDHNLLVRHLKQLLNNETISCPVYDYKIHRRSKDIKMVTPHSLIILEGILIFNKTQLRDLMDFLVFIDISLDICFIRRLKRDITERGRSVDSVIQQYTETVRPMYFQFIEPSKQYADILIPKGGKNSVAINLLITAIKTMLNDNPQ